VCCPTLRAGAQVAQVEGDDLAMGRWPVPGGGVLGRLFTRWVLPRGHAVGATALSMESNPLSWTETREAIAAGAMSGRQRVTPAYAGTRRR